jgi:hypothetical protein
MPFSLSRKILLLSALVPASRAFCAFRPRTCWRPSKAKVPSSWVSFQASTLSLDRSEEASKTKEEPVADIDISTIRRWTEEAIQCRGTISGLKALKSLREASEKRLPYIFEEENADFDVSKEVVNPELQRQLLPLAVTRDVSRIVKEMEAEGCLSTNLDSVDGLPSFHLNLVSNGKPLFPKNDDGSAKKSVDPQFVQNVQKIRDLVGPHIYNELLPKVKKMVKSENIQVQDIFLRRYGQDCEDARKGISAHYDVFSKVTSVIALDDVAEEGNNGLYTTVSTELDKVKRQTSNHASLRRYFPLREGDGVVHTWDVLHGVDVLPGSDRTSLIVWFTEETSSHSRGIDNGTISPWLVRDYKAHPEDDVTQFVLASALESAHGLTSRQSDQRNRNDGADETNNQYTNDAAMFQSMSSVYMEHGSSPDNMLLSPQELYLKSAAQGNVFALSRLGRVCESEGWASTEMQEEARALLETLRMPTDIPEPLVPEGLSLGQSMAWRYWFEGAVRGNPAAQFSLADDMVFHAVVATKSDSTNETLAGETRLLAAVLFGLAAQQGNEDAIDKLAQVVELEVASRDIQSEREFQDNPVVKTAQAAMAASR